MIKTNREVTLSILLMMVLLCGVSSLSYAQEDDALTFSNLTCAASDVDQFFGTATITLKGTMHAIRAVTDVRGWLTIDGTVMSPSGFPAINDPITGRYYGGKSFGDLSAGETKDFSITAINVRINAESTCGYYFGGMMSIHTADRPRSSRR